MNAKLLNIKNLKVDFETDGGTISPIDDVSLDIGDSETLALVGESGCGKSMTAMSIMGLIDKPGKVSGGSIEFMGKDLVRMPKGDWHKVRGNDIAMIFQEPLTSLNPVFTVGKQISEAIRLHQRVSRQEARQKSIDLLQRVGIPRAEKIYDSYPHSLSGGMRQRAMIAIALSCNPRILIADEPTTALDVTIQAQILKLMKQLSEEYQTAVLIITHDLGVVAEMADKVVIMYAGQVVESGDVYSIFASPKHPYTKGLLDSTPKIDVTTDELKTIEGVVPGPGNYPAGCRFGPRCGYSTVRCSNEVPALEEVTKGCSVRCWMYCG